MSAQPAPLPGEARWLAPTVKRLNELLALPENWDSYGAARVDPRAIDHALRLLGITMHPETPPPAVVPTPHGGVQLEWHQKTVDLEIEVPPVGALHVAYENFATGVNWEDDLQIDLAPLAQVLADLQPSR